jgi:addiction module RelE/StbE family toxin
MKSIKWSTTFTNQYRQRIRIDEQLQKEFQDSVAMFLADRTVVDDHPLEGKMAGWRAFSINDDYRVVYLERDEYFLFIYVGTHRQVYIR